MYHFNHDHEYIIRYFFYIFEWAIWTNKWIELLYINTALHCISYRVLQWQGSASIITMLLLHIGMRLSWGKCHKIQWNEFITSMIVKYIFISYNYLMWLCHLLCLNCKQKYDRNIVKKYGIRSLETKSITYVQCTTSGISLCQFAIQCTLCQFAIQCNWSIMIK